MLDLGDGVDKIVDFSLPSVIRDFIFDLHDAMRRSRRDDELNLLYEIKFKEITEKYFSQGPWPRAEVVGAEASNDEGFLLFYREMSFRHITTKLKPQLCDHLASWANYVKLFEFILASEDGDFCITPKWVYDITQEFAYQFQGFCQLRCQLAHHNTETIRVLEANRDVWNFPKVINLLKKLIYYGKAKSQGMQISPNSPPSVLFGYFATIELARLQCLLGDFTSSLKAISSIALNDRSELFKQLPVCHLNVFYHTGVCNMMLRKFPEASEVFNEIILFVSKILKPGAAANLRLGVAPQLQRMLDKVLALTAIVITLSPSSRVDDQAMEMIEAKWSDKYRKLQQGEKSTFVELFEFASPKYISPLVPNYSLNVSINQEAAQHMLNTFITEVQQHIAFLKLRSYFGLYASIDISKLARFNDIGETDLLCLLTSLKHKQATSSRNMDKSTTIVSSRPRATTHFFIDNNVLVVDSNKKEAAGAVFTDVNRDKQYEKHFISGVRKHVEMKGQLDRTFIGLKL